MYSIIVCVDKNNAIGKGGKIPWKLKGEQLRFKKLTTNKTIVMGRKSFEEIGKPLLNRKNVIVSNSKNFVGDNLITINNLEEWLEKNKNSQEEIFICGGYNVYKTALNYVNKIYLTKAELEVVDADTFFPEVDFSQFIKTYEEKISNEIPYTYYTYEKIQ